MFPAHRSLQLHPGPFDTLTGCPPKIRRSLRGERGVQVFGCSSVAHCTAQDSLRSAVYSRQRPTGTPQRSPEIGDASLSCPPLPVCEPRRPFGRRGPARAPEDKPVRARPGCCSESRAHSGQHSCGGMIYAPPEESICLDGNGMTRSSWSTSIRPKYSREFESRCATTCVAFSIPPPEGHNVSRVKEGVGMLSSTLSESFGWLRKTREPVLPRLRRRETLLYNSR